MREQQEWQRIKAERCNINPSSDITLPFLILKLDIQILAVRTLKEVWKKNQIGSEEGLKLISRKEIMQISYLSGEKYPSSLIYC